MIACNNSISDIEKKVRKITFILIFAGILASVCLVFFFMQLFNARSNSLTPTVYNLEQIGATDTSVLIAWGHSDAPCEYVVRYRSLNDARFSEFRTNQPFAAIHGLAPYTKYKTNVTPVDANGEHDTYSVICNTAPYCHVTQVDVSDVTHNSAKVTWNFEGIDSGFTVIAYALDSSGKRNMTGEKLSVASGEASECTLTNLLSDVHYTVCVKPDTKYFEMGKSDFTTAGYSRVYNRFSIIRFVTCTYDSDDSMYVRIVNNLNPGEKYKASIVFNGQATTDEKIELKLYVTDLNGNLITCAVKKEIPVNPDNVAWYIYRTMMEEFKAPTAPGDYYIYAAIDNVTATRTPFRVVAN